MELVEAQPCDECSVMELISQADEIMYEQKQQYHIEQARRRLACSPEEERQRIRDFDYDKEHLCDALMESTDDYIFVGNMKTGTFRYSPRMVEEFGLPGLSSQMPRQCGEKESIPEIRKSFWHPTRRSRTDVQSHTVYSTVHEIAMTSGSGCSAAAI